MLSKNELKYIQSLCQKKQRQEEGLFIAEGPKLVGELLESNYSIRKIYATPEWVGPAVRSEVERVVIDDITLARISALQTPHQVLALVEQPSPAPEPTLEGRFTLVLDGIQDPGNLGTLIRIADWFGITQVIAGNDTVELYNPKVIQSTMGSFIRVVVYYKQLTSFLESVAIPVYGALLDGENMYNMNPVSEGLLVIGNESKGIRPELLPYLTHPVSIPRRGGAESLNAGVAAGILLSHLLK